MLRVKELTQPTRRVPGTKKQCVMKARYYQMEFVYNDGRPNLKGARFENKDACEKGCEKMNAVHKWKTGKWVCVKH